MALKFGLQSLYKGTRNSPIIVNKIEPIPANVYTEQSAKGTFIRKNKELEKVFRKAGINNKETWDKILADGGSVQDIKELDKWCYVSGKATLCSDVSESDDPIPVKEVFKTFKENVGEQ